MTDLTLPRRVGADGQRLQPTGLNPYDLPWVQGAAQTVTRRVREAHREQIRDLAEKVAVLQSKRPADYEARVERFLNDANTPDYGPRRRPAAFIALAGTPLPSNGRVFSFDGGEQ